MSLTDGLPSRGFDDNLPYGTWSGDPSAPWNAPDPVECPDCGEDMWPGAECEHCGHEDTPDEGPDPDYLRDLEFDRQCDREAGY